VEAAAAPASAPLLATDGVRKRFGALVVLEDVSIELPAGGALGIVGPNGAGKTTLLDVLAGATRPDAGRVLLGGDDVTRLDAAARCRLGIGRTHQVPRPFGGMTAFENVLVGAMMGGAQRRASARARAVDALETTGLIERGNRRADTLGLLDRKRLELARALATGPEVLLLDEIAGGLTEAETSDLVEEIRGLLRAGIAIVWIEHVVHALLRVAERLVCMSAGRIVADGAPDAVMNDPAVISAYLGSGV
jgi:branched-chain amino acid transport system ATP-binding protein